jgi:hypothetical protein
MLAECSMKHTARHAAKGRSIARATPRQKAPTERQTHLLEGAAATRGVAQRGDSRCGRLRGRRRGARARIGDVLRKRQHVQVGEPIIGRQRLQHRAAFAGRCGLRRLFRRVHMRAHQHMRASWHCCFQRTAAGAFAAVHATHAVTHSQHALHA